MTLYDFELFNCVFEGEFVFSVFKKNHFPGKIVGNLDCFLARYTFVSRWQLFSSIVRNVTLRCIKMSQLP